MKGLSKRNAVAAAAGLILLTTAGGVALAAKPSSSTASTTQIAEHIERRIFKVIHASDEQKEKLSAIFTSMFDQNTELRTELKSKVLDLSKAYADDNVTGDQIKERIAKIEDVRAKLRTRRVDALLSARQILTAKQRQILSERLSERFE